MSEATTAVGHGEGGEPVEGGSGGPTGGPEHDASGGPEHDASGGPEHGGAVVPTTAVGHGEGGGQEQGASGGSTIRRIHIIGGSGSGKTTIATRLGEHLDVPVHHLDVIARDPRTGARFPIEQRRERVRELLAMPASVTEGIHLGWTEPLLAAADVIVWLDSVSPPIAARRVLLRFVRDAVGEFRRKRGVRAKFLRFRDYAHHIRELGRSLREIWSYHEELRDDGTPVGDAGNRSATQRELGPFMSKVVHIRRPVDLAALGDSLPRNASGERFELPVDEELPRPPIRHRTADRG